ncbi:ATP-binding protein [Streptomyces sp. 3211]|uniref:ATP-binding protein n=1 Tax=Streptomyces sp. 3211 TaxID=1964449 RepID=UPI0009A53689|nr:ATP-binding protein [Streptomyces sp. 3211]
MSIATPPLATDALGRAGLRTSLPRSGRAEAVFERTGQLTRDAPRTRQARRIAAALLRLWGLEELVDPVCLAVSELVTNALVHGQGDNVTVRMLLSDTQLRVEVCDAGSWTPRLQPPDPLAQGGRGTLLVQAFADAWGVAEGGPVWCVFNLSASAAGAAA